jgi:hypothetical protein
MMSIRTLVVAALAVGASMIAAPRQAESQVVGYGIFGPTVLSGGSEYLVSGTTAAGAEFLINGRVGVGVEAGFIGTPMSGWPVLSATGVLHLTSSRRGESRVSPFVAAGISTIDSGRPADRSWNVGGGVDIWLRDRVGLRIDYRDHFTPQAAFTPRYSMLRVGVSFR